MLNIRCKGRIKAKRMIPAAVMALLMLFGAACGSGSSGTNTPVKSATPSATGSGTPFTANHVLAVPGISAEVNLGKVSFTKGSKAGYLLGTIHGTVHIVNGTGCPYCMSTVQIAANLQVPAGAGHFFLTEPLPFESGSGDVGYDGGLEAVLPEHSRYWISAGGNGAVLKKQGAGFLLVSGTALLLDKGSSS